MKRLMMFLTTILFLMTAAGTSQGALTAADLVVYDDVAQQYWIRDLGTFTFMTYNEQINKIADINADSNYQSPYWGEWRMATESDMENLWEYSAEEITESFEPSDEDLGEISGRYEKANIAYSEGELIEQHYWVQTSRIGPFKQDLPGNLIPDYVSDADFLGAWVVADALDTDVDSVPDAVDYCPGTAAGVKVDQDGCSGEQLVDLACPCDNDWKNHGQYVSCVAQSAEEQIDAGLITEDEKDTIVSARAKSGCGK